MLKAVVTTNIRKSNGMGCRREL